MTTGLLAVAFIASIASAPAAEALTIGSPGPGWGAVTFIRGDAVTELAKGTVYVVEFSGTDCVPCLKCIPHLNELQKKYPAVVVVSVYGQDEATVRKYLAGPGREIAYRVAADPGRALGQAWSDAACQEAIPHAFIVGTDGRIAWLGNAADVAAPLARILAGTFDPQEDVLRLKVEQGAVLARRRDEEGTREYARINEKIVAGKLEAALADTERALDAYRGCPRTTDLLHSAEVYLLANLPGRREDAFRLATELAVAAKSSGRSAALLGMGANLLNAAERRAPGARDSRLIDLALPLLRESLPDDLAGKPEATVAEFRVQAQRLAGYAYHLRGDPARAADAIRDAMALVKAQKPPEGADAEQFAENMKRRLQDLGTILKEYGGGQ